LSRRALHPQIAPGCAPREAAARPFSLSLLAALAISLVLSLLWHTPVAHAHPADMYSQRLALTLAADSLHIDWQILPGPFLADAVWSAADSNQDGVISPAEAQGWVGPFLAGLDVQLDGTQLAATSTPAVHWPATVDLLRTGEDQVQFALDYAIGALPVGSPHALKVHASHLEANSLNWFALTAGSGLTFAQPSQTNGLLSASFDGPSTTGAPSSSANLTSWNSGIPNLPAFGAAVSQIAAGLASSSPSTDTASPAPSVTATLTGLVKTEQFSPLFLLGAFLLSLVLGSLHALTPGHGKALVGAYLVGSQGKTRDAVFLGTIVTVTHTGSVVLLGLVTLFASHYVLPALIAPWLEIISGLLVVGFGLSLLLRRRADLATWLASDRKSSSLPAHEQGTTEGHEHTHFGGEHTHEHGTPHDHAHGHSHDHDHTHELPRGAVTLRSLLTLGVSGGLVPCPDAIAILLVAVAVNRIPFGMLLIVSFSIGLALVLIGIGIAMVNGVRLIARSDLLSRFAVYTPVLSAVVVTGLGAALTATAFNSLRFGTTVVQSAGSAPAASAASAGFDLRTARMMYVASDAAGWDQLFTTSVGGTPQQITTESSGITGYSISPDGRTVLYTLFNAAGGTAIWAVDPDGSNRRLVLDCPASECNSPRWYPDGRRIVYDRLDDAAQAAVPRFSIWWLDIQTGNTSPVFQDQSFASYAPDFSPDGQWLSYVSTADNTLILYEMATGATHSIPLGLQASLPGTWSPNGGAVLFASEPANETRVRTKVYDLASEAITDLGGPPESTDYSAAWSPDGAWIAIDRNLPTDASSGNQVWLLRPDGTEAHAILMEDGASYSSLKWSPDSRYLLYSRYVLDLSAATPGRFDIYLFDTEAGSSTLVVEGGDMPAFLP
jgi:nickel/cobalt exporter